MRGCNQSETVAFCSSSCLLFVPAQLWVLSMGWSPTEKDWASIGPSWAFMGPTRKAAPVWETLLRLQLLPGIWFSMGSLCAPSYFRKYPPAPVRGTSWAAACMSVPPWPSLCRGISAPVLGVSPPTSSLTLVSTRLFLVLFFLSPNCCAVFCILLHVFYQRCHHVGWLTQLCPVMNLLMLPGMRQPLASSHGSQLYHPLIHVFFFFFSWIILQIYS